MRKAASAFAAGAAVLCLAACGSAHRAAASYSVSQVESAFGVQGVALRKVRRQPERGIVVLVADPQVRVLVDLERASYSAGWTGERPTGRGNVTVFRGGASVQTVKTALSHLH